MAFLTLLCTQKWMLNSAFLSNPCISACDPVSCWQRMPLVMWDTVSWMRMALCSPRKDLEGCSIKACEGFRYYWTEVGWGRHQLLFLKRHLSPAVGGMLYWPKVKLVVASIKPFHYVLTHVHLPGSVSGLCKWADTADSLKTGACEERVSATPKFSHFNIVTSSKPKPVWLILSRKCSCCGYTTRTFAGVSFSCAVPSPISPSTGWHCRFQKSLPERYKLSPYIKHTS